MPKRTISPTAEGPTTPKTKARIDTNVESGNKTRTVQDILDELEAKHNLRLLPAERDPLAQKHKQLDDDLKNALSTVTDLRSNAYKWVPAFVFPISNAGGARHCELNEWITLLTDGLILELVQAIWATNASFDVVRRLPIFWEVSHEFAQPEILSVGRKAIASSWSVDFRGPGAKNLRSTLENGLQKENMYARYVPLIQSSGTGKSRMVKEVGQRVITIQLNISKSRIRQGSSYPPPDMADFVDWLYGTKDDIEDLQLLLCHYESFLFGLLTVLKERLQDIETETPSTEHVDMNTKQKKKSRLARLASKFQEKTQVSASQKDSNEDLELWKHPLYREHMLDDIKAEATEFRKSASLRDVRKDSLYKRLVKQSPGGGDISTTTAAKDLCDFLDPKWASRKKPKLLLLIALDESHSMTDIIQLKTGYHAKYNQFTVLRLALRDLLELPIFTVFMSTGGDFTQFSQKPHADPSDRLSFKALHSFSPITATGLDQFAPRPGFDGESAPALETVASIKNISHLGRALFPTYFDNGTTEQKSNIIGFAAQKLLCTPEPPTDISSLDLDRQLACLSVRLDLEIRAPEFEAGMQRRERKQVERHMRICLSASPGFTAMTTISASEPLLAEAAFAITSSSSMKATWNAASALNNQVQASYLSMGDRGEVVASLLVLLARDAARKTAHSYGDNMFTDPYLDNGSHRLISVVQFLEALLNMKKEDIVSQNPSVARAEDEGVSLGGAFKGANIWFNHIKKVQDYEMIKPKYLCSLVARGAAVLCADNQAAVDIVVPIVFDRKLEKKNISAILIQVKNDTNFNTAGSVTRLFDALNPSKVHLSDDEGEMQRPIIRMVFSLASLKPSVSLQFPSERKSPRFSHSFTAYDVWCAGVSAQTFRVVSVDDEETYQSLLRSALSIQQSYDLRDNDGPHASALRRSMNPAVSAFKEHLDSFTDYGWPDVPQSKATADEDSTDDEEGP